MAGSSSGGTLLATVVTIVILLSGINYITDGMVASTLFPDGTSGTAATGVYSGTVTPSVSHVDAINPTNTYGGGSAVTLSWLKCAGCNGIGEYTNIAKKGNESFVLSQNDNGKAYAHLLNSGASADVYLSYYKTYQANQGLLENIVYTDYNGDDTKDHVAKFNVNSLAANSQAVQIGGNDLDMPIAIAWYKKASTISGVIQEPTAAVVTGGAKATGGFRCASAAAGECLVNMAGALNETKLVYRFTMDSFDKIVLVNQIWLQLNNTDDVKWQQESIKMELAFYNPETGTAGPLTSYKVGDMGSTLLTGSSNSTYKWSFADDLSDIVKQNTILYTKTGEQKYVDITFTIKWNLIATDRINAGVKLVYLDDTGNSVSASAGRVVYGGGSGGG